MVASAHVKRQQRKEISAILALAIGVFLSFCLFSYHPADPGLNVATDLGEVVNLGGPVGAYLADFLFTIFGISAYVLAGIFFLVSTLLFLGHQVRVNVRQAVAYLVMIFAAAMILHLRFELVTIRGQPVEAGGLVGGLLAQMTTHYLNTVGAYVFAATLFFLAFLYATHLSLGVLCRWTWQLFVFTCAKCWQWTVILSARIRRSLPKLIRALSDQWARYQEWIVARRAGRTERRAEQAKMAKKIKVNLQPSPKAQTTRAAAPPTAKHQVTTPEDAPKADDATEGAEAKAEGPAEGSAKGPKIFERRDDKDRAKKGAQLELTRISANYIYPSLGFLDYDDSGRVAVDEQSLRNNAKVLEMKLAEYGIRGSVTEIHPGPVVTMYELQPAPGVKVNKIVGTSDDLSVSVGGRSVRIVPHLPGKAAVGVEIPNAHRETVWLKEIIGDNKFRKIHSKLPLAIGKNIEGHAVIADLAKMPHLLVAGATGSGKSVAINAMICSLLYKSTPAEVRMILVDPKMLELSIYDGIPHLLLPVVTKPRHATLALQWAVREMEQRYCRLSDAAVRNIAGYNERIERGELECVSEEEATAHKEKNPDVVCHTGALPYIVIIIDEMADLMMVAARDIEESVTRLAQMARAAGIHLILATQRPSVDVLTGLIKANFPSRVSFKVSSKHDARTILDTVGSEHLLGFGDMLFMAPNTSNLVRLHGALVTEKEIERIVTHVKQQAKPVYNTSILKPSAEVSGGVDEDYDELYDQAVQLVTDTKQASISMVQRRLRIGYNRAARMIERMESEGIIGPAVGSKPREILVQSH